MILIPSGDSNPSTSPSPPLCDRCHNLLHHHSGGSIVHPTLDSIREIISESPHKYNHVYHVLDAADFPLSLIPQLQQCLSIAPQRSQNRRAKLEKFYNNRKMDMSFIITRSDLLAPSKEQVDSMMPALLDILRDALKVSAAGIRLGNVRCVSSKRGWWTKKLKEEIRGRGGGGWMVGMVNVGKSNLFEAVFPKGGNPNTTHQNLSSIIPTSKNPLLIRYAKLNGDDELEKANKTNDLLISNTLLPPAPLETPYPVMPIVSHMPGTTASPIRLPFGGGKGELIDLPGIARCNLGDYVTDEHKPSLVMRHRIKSKQFTIKPGQSLMLGNLIKITPRLLDTVLLAYPFVPLECHVTNTQKASLIQSQDLNRVVTGITKPGVGECITSAGVLELRWDVTKQRSGPLTASSAIGLKTKELPFIVFSADILIEGVGWVELAAQVRKKISERFLGPESPTTVPYPSVEIFSPYGKHIGIRQPLNTWLVGGEKKAPVSQRTARPRRSMRGVKKRLKQTT